ncbi:MAG: hypothetical protein R3B13_39310 [Polyangiaceae bacterium]
MGFGFSLQSWRSSFDEQSLAAIGEFVTRVNPSQSWDELMTAKPSPPFSFELWREFGEHFTLLMERYGLVAPYEAVHLLPVDFTETLDDDDAADAPIAVALTDERLVGKTYVLEADLVDRAWRASRDDLAQYSCRAYAKTFDAWMESLSPGTIDEAIARFSRRDDAFDIVYSRLELAWVHAARAAQATRCPVSVFW